jgi:hypothetical protein
MNFSLDGDRGGTFCLDKAGLIIATTTTAVKIANAIDYCIDGALYTKAITDNIAMTAADQQAVATRCLYLVQINAAGTVSTVKGVEKLTANITADQDALDWPLPAAGNCPIGFVEVETNASTTFTAGTTALSAAGITDTYIDTFAVPVRPRT